MGVRRRNARQGGRVRTGLLVAGVRAERLPGGERGAAPDGAGQQRQIPTNALARSVLPLLLGRRLLLRPEDAGSGSLCLGPEGLSGRDRRCRVRVSSPTITNTMRAF